MANLEKLPTDLAAAQAKINEALIRYEAETAYAQQIAEITADERSRILGLPPLRLCRTDAKRNQKILNLIKNGTPIGEAILIINQQNPTE
jgi:hypothetical protein